MTEEEREQLGRGRAKCPKCGKKGLGYAMHAHAFGFKDYDRFRCRYCKKTFKRKEPKPPAPPAPPAPGELRVNLPYWTMMPRNCPLIEQTADGTEVGVCCFFLSDGKTCPRHGDVTERVERAKHDRDLRRAKNERDLRG